jgi:predicted acylesterase/phospholipase RssA
VPEAPSDFRQVGHVVPADGPLKPRTILALSGGGMYGAYTAGVLNGWTKAGNRPTFDVITGISTGALIAPLAFLGPDYDRQMEMMYTRIRRRDIFTYRSWATVAFRDAVASTAPLREIVETAVTDEFVQALAAEHKKGRRLYIGTTNLDTKRFITWDVGAIAAQGGKAARKLIGDVMIASCSLPGVFPPVPVDVEVNGKRYTELHIDGGVTAPLFVPQGVLDAAALDPAVPLPAQAPATVYVIQAGKAFTDPGPVQSKVLPVLGAGTAALVSAQARREVANLFHLCRLSGIRFQMTALAADFPTPAGGLEFDRPEMNKLFEEGFRVGSSGPLWWAAPPERTAGELDPVRTGNRFRSGK